MENLASCYERVAKHSEALNIYKELLLSDLRRTDHATILNKMAFLYENLGNFDEAIRLYTQRFDLFECKEWIENEIIGENLDLDEKQIDEGEMCKAGELCSKIASLYGFIGRNEIATECYRKKHSKVFIWPEQ